MNNARYARDNLSTDTLFPPLRCESNGIGFADSAGRVFFFCFFFARGTESENRSDRADARDQSPLRDNATLAFDARRRISRLVLLCLVIRAFAITFRARAVPLFAKDEREEHGRSFPIDAMARATAQLTSD